MFVLFKRKCIRHLWWPSIGEARSSRCDCYNFFWYKATKRLESGMNNVWIEFERLIIWVKMKNNLSSPPLSLYSYRVLSYCCEEDAGVRKTNFVSRFGPISLMKMVCPSLDTAISCGEINDRREVHVSTTCDVFQSMVKPWVAAGADPAPFTPYSLPAVDQRDMDTYLVSLIMNDTSLTSAHQSIKKKIKRRSVCLHEYAIPKIRPI